MTERKTCAQSGLVMLPFMAPADYHHHETIMKYF